MSYFCRVILEKLMFKVFQEVYTMLVELELINIYMKL